MGCWNGTCAVTNLHIRAGQEVAVFMLLENKNKRSFCYSNAAYDICPIPFYGEYNDYGAVENCNGFGLNIVVDAIRNQLYEFGQGPNSAHDNPVNRKDFNIDVLFDADHEGRLGVQQGYVWDDESYDISSLEKMRDESGLTASQEFELDRLANKIKKVDTFRQVTHVIIHGDVFKSITEKWFVEQYVGDSKGNKGYENNYIHVYLKDIIDSIPEYIERQKKAAEAVKGDNPATKLMARMMRRHGVDDYNDPNLAAKWLAGVGRGGEGNTFGLINASESINDYVEAENWDGLASFTEELLIGVWVNTFMEYNRKIWTKQCGAGSQNSEADGYILLADTVKEILAAERTEYGYDDEDDEEIVTEINLTVEQK